MLVNGRMSCGMQSRGRRKGGNTLGGMDVSFVYVSEVAVLRADWAGRCRSVVAAKGIVARMQ